MIALNHDMRLIPRNSRGLVPPAALTQPQRHVRCAALRVTPIITTVTPPMLLAGAITGPLLDGIHGTVNLLTYDVLPVTIGPLHTALTVPVLLAAFYAVVGCMTVAADELLPDPATQRALQRCRQPPWVALTAGSVAALLALSAVLYSRDVDYTLVRDFDLINKRHPPKHYRFQRRWRSWACCTGGRWTARGRAWRSLPCVPWRPQRRSCC